MRQIIIRYKGTSQSLETTGPWAEPVTWKSWVIKTDVPIAPISHSASIFFFPLSHFLCYFQYACLRPTLFSSKSNYWETESDCPCLSQVSSCGQVRQEVDGDAQETGKSLLQAVPGKSSWEDAPATDAWGNWTTDHEARVGLEYILCLGELLKLMTQPLLLQVAMPWSLGPLKAWQKGCTFQSAAINQISEVTWDPLKFQVWEDPGNITDNWNRAFIVGLLLPKCYLLLLLLQQCNSFHHPQTLWKGDKLKSPLVSYPITGDHEWYLKIYYTKIFSQKLHKIVHTKYVRAGGAWSDILFFFK